MVKVMVQNVNGYNSYSTDGSMVFKDLQVDHSLTIMETQTSIIISANPTAITFPTSILPGGKNSILMTDSNGLTRWVSAEETMADLLHHPTIRDRIEAVIAAQKDLEMTIKLVRDEDSREHDVH